MPQPGKIRSWTSRNLPVRRVERDYAVAWFGPWRPSLRYRRLTPRKSRWVPLGISSCCEILSSSNAYLGTYRFPPANKTVTFSGSTSCDFSFSGREVEAAFPIEIRAMVSARLASARVLRWKALDVEVIL
jgi:hypothetical protein